MPDVVVDRQLCTGNGECLRIAPAAFRLDDAGISTPTPAASSTPAGLLVAAAGECPEQAITVRDGTGPPLYET